MNLPDWIKQEWEKIRDLYLAGESDPKVWNDYYAQHIMGHESPKSIEEAYVQGQRDAYYDVQFILARVNPKTGELWTDDELVKMVKEKFE